MLCGILWDTFGFMVYSGSQNSAIHIGLLLKKKLFLFCHRTMVFLFFSLLLSKMPDYSDASQKGKKKFVRLK